MDTINQRISALITYLGVTKAAFAKSLGTTSSRIANITQGRNKPDSQLLEGIVTTYPDIDATWLLTGVGVLGRNMNYSRPEFIEMYNRRKDFYTQVDTPPDTQVSTPPTQSSTTKTGKSTTNAPSSKEENRQFNLLKADGIRNTVEAAAVGSEAAQRWGARRITESKLYKRFPHAESEGLNACFAASYLGQDSDRFLKALNDSTHTRIDAVLDQVIDGEINMEQAALEIELLTGPLNDLQAYFERLENAIFNMVTAVVKVYPEAMVQVRGTALHHGLLQWEVDNETDLEITV